MLFRFRGPLAGSPRADHSRSGPESFSTIARFAIVAGLITLTCTGFLLSQYPVSGGTLREITNKIPKIDLHPGPDSANAEYRQANRTYHGLVDHLSDGELHPIDRLIADAQKSHEAILAKRSNTVPEAAARYREARGRHPPPGFDEWMKYAMAHDAIIVEEFFDRIYQDLAPFWALDPNTTASRAESWHHVVRVRDGVATGIGNTEGRVAWLELWTKLVAEAAPHLPDVDMPINYMDESRLLVRWEDISNYVTEEQKRRKIPPITETVQIYSGLADIDSGPEAGANGSKAYDPEWTTTDSPRYWNLARVGCAPDSPSRDVMALSDFTRPPSFPYDWRPPFSERGFVKNFTASADACTQPHLRALHGTFIEPLSMSSSAELIPLFGGCKLTMNNEILIPGAMYLTEDPFYSGGDKHGPHWNKKNNTIVWRGVGSGGRNKKENWMHFQRHRMLEMLNGTTVASLEHNGARAMSFDMAPLQLYDYPRRRNNTVGEMLQKASDVGFTELLCFPSDDCSYVEPHFHEVEKMPMEVQYTDKFIPDTDGNSFSARFRGLLLSTSLPIKATVYAEWHDNRLQPWLHFAPMDNTFQELHAMLDFFLGSPKGDAAAWLMASNGKRWAEKVLRREDMLLYVWRLLLEFARVCDPKRDVMGFISDIEGAPPIPPPVPRPPKVPKPQVKVSSSAPAASASSSAAAPSAAASSVAAGSAVPPSAAPSAKPTKP